MGMCFDMVFLPFEGSACSKGRYLRVPSTANGRRERPPTPYFFYLPAATRASG